MLVCLCAQLSGQHRLQRRPRPLDLIANAGRLRRVALDPVDMAAQRADHVAYLVVLDTLPYPITSVHNTHTHTVSPIHNS